MKFFVMILMCVSASLCYAKPDIDTVSTPETSNAEIVYNSVISGDFAQASDQILNLERVAHSSFIKDTVDKLLREKKKSVFDIAYKLWFGKGQDIVKKYFPEQFRLILSGEKVKIVFKRDNLALKLGASADSSNDRSAYGDASDKTSDNVGWKFTTLRHNDQLFFTIKSVARNQYLKLGTAADSDGEHTAYGADSHNDERHFWYLVPAIHDGELLFFIHNSKFNQALKLGRAVDSMGDRILYGNYYDVSDHPELYGFSISAL